MKNPIRTITLPRGRTGYSTRPKRLKSDSMVKNVSVAVPHGKHYGRDEYPVRPVNCIDLEDYEDYP